MMKIFLILFVLWLLFGRRRERRGFGMGFLSLLALGAGFLFFRIMIAAAVIAILAGILGFFRFFLFLL